MPKLVPDGKRIILMVNGVCNVKVSDTMSIGILMLKELTRCEGVSKDGGTDLMLKRVSESEGIDPITKGVCRAKRRN